MKEDFSIPKEFEHQYELLRHKGTITKREYIDICLLGTKLSRTHWKQRQGIAYNLAGIWLRHKNISDDPVLDDIGGEFGSLELPDHHIAKSEEGVRKRWDEVATLVAKASDNYR